MPSSTKKPWDYMKLSEEQKRVLDEVSHDLLDLSNTLGLPTGGQKFTSPAEEEEARMALAATAFTYLLAIVLGVSDSLKAEIKTDPEFHDFEKDATLRFFTAIDQNPDIQAKLKKLPYWNLVAHALREMRSVCDDDS